jgi:hypothetical protein
MTSESPVNEYRPELLSRRGEFTAWALAFLLVVTWFVLQLKSQPVYLILPLMAAFFVFAALGISLSNWMDRRTSIRLDTIGITFKNGLRQTFLGWSEIYRIEVFPSSWGKKVRVFGETGYFEFRTLIEVKYNGEVRGRMGFMEGEIILTKILDESGLQETSHSGPGSYYARD